LICGDPGLGPLTQWVLGNVLAELGKYGGPLGAGSHDVHFTPEHVQQLRELVESVLAQETTHGRDPRVLLLGPHRATPLLGIDPHGSELIDRKRLTTEVVLAAMVLGTAGLSSPVEADAYLSVENWTAGGQPDQ
jgi:hypothetical protein